MAGSRSVDPAGSNLTQIILNGAKYRIDRSGQTRSR
jgi:hypothetical protein